MRFLLGGYTADMEGHAAGIGMLRAGAADDPLAGGPLAYDGVVAPAASPSWIAWHPTLDVVYASLEATGTVAAFQRTGETSFAPLGTPSEAGSAVCHLAVSPDGSFLVATCWGDGRVVRIPLDAAGRPGAPALAAAARDPYGAPGVEGVVEASDRTTRAHSSVFLGDGRLATTDLGYDLVRFWRIGTAGITLDHEVVLPFGTGPRHMVLHPSGHLHVVTEFSCEVFTLGEGDDGRWRLLGGTNAAPLEIDGDAAAELARSRDGRYLYAGLRGTNTLSVLQVRGAGDGVTPVALVESGVDWPRHHVIARDTILVAGQRSDDVVSLAIDERTGVPGRVRHRAEAPTPTCLLPLR
jgi:6-phosphogluconolactonase (cycloisomerase 2 family)